MVRRNADIAKAMEELRHLDERNCKFPSAFQQDLHKIISKHKIGSITKVPDYITTMFIEGCLNSMRIAFARYLIQVNHEAFEVRGEAYTSIDSRKTKRTKHNVFHNASYAVESSKKRDLPSKIASK